MLFLDRAHSFDGSRPMFHRAPRPTPAEIDRLLHRIAIGLNAGCQALTLRTVTTQPEPVASTLLAKQPGFSLYAATCCEANQCENLEKLCR